MRPFHSLEYAGRQGARVAWYMGHYLASRRFRDSRPAQEHRPSGRGPGRDYIFARMGELFARDLANVGKGYYPMPRDHGQDAYPAGPFLPPAGWTHRLVRQRRPFGKQPRGRRHLTPPPLRLNQVAHVI